MIRQGKDKKKTKKQKKCNKYSIDFENACSMIRKINYKHITYCTNVITKFPI